MTTEVCKNKACCERGAKGGDHVRKRAKVLGDHVRKRTKILGDHVCKGAKVLANIGKGANVLWK